jgi:hypothetical protein
MKRILFILILVLLVLGSGCVQQETGSRPQNYDEISGTVVSENLIVDLGYFSEFPENFKVSPDSSRFVYVEKKENK